MASEDYLSITDTARECKVPRAAIQYLFDRNRLERDRCLRIAGRTLIHRDYIEAVVKPELRRQGHEIPRTAHPAV